jgi:PAS domain S-box-containing protein
MKVQNKSHSEGSANKEYTLLLEKITSHIPGLVAVYNIHTGQYLFVNGFIKKILGYEREDFLNNGVQFVASLMHPEDSTRILDQNKQALKKANNSKLSTPIVNFEYRMKHKNGKWIWFLSQGVVFKRNKSGEIEEVMNISLDITDRKEKEFREKEKRTLAEEKLKQSEHRFRSLIENESDGIVMIDPNGYFTYASPSVARILGYSAKELIGKHSSILYPKSVEGLEDLINALYRPVYENPGTTLTVEHPYIHKNGTQKWLLSTVTNLTNDPDINSFIGNFTDITRRKNTFELLRRQGERLSLALDAGKIGVWDWDLITNQIEWTDKIYEIHDIPKNKAIGGVQEYINYIYPEDRERVKKAIEEALNGVRPYEIEFRIITPRGETRWLSTSAHIIRDGEKPIRMLGATTDISRRKQLEIQKDEFLGIASHELKTPVTSLKAYEQVLHSRFKRQGDEESASMLLKMDGQINKLTSLIHDLLDVNKIEGGRLQFHHEIFNFNDVVAEVIEDIQRTTERHKIIRQGKINQTVYGDKERIGQVITNLLTNAIKYSPNSNKIIVKSFCKDNRIYLSVKDYGVGIPKKELPYVFDRFFRVNTKLHNTVPGMGLGLYISSEIIKRQGGEIWADSTFNKGSTFSFSLPINSNLHHS